MASQLCLTRCNCAVIKLLQTGTKKKVVLNYFFVGYHAHKITFIKNKVRFY